MLLSEFALRNGVKVGNLFYKSNDVSKAISRCVRLVLMESKTDGLTANQSLGYLGSSTLVSHKGEKWVVLTRHQLGIPVGASVDLFTLDQIRIASSKGGRISNIQTDRCVFEEANPEEEYHDLLALHVAEQSTVTNKDSYAFMPLLPKGQRRQRLVSVAVGYPASSSEMDYDNDHVTMGVAVFDCTVNVEYRSSNTHLQQFSYAPQEREVDGLSGGAIFSLTRGREGLEFLLDGIILRGGGGFLYSVAASYVRQLVGGLP